MLPFAHISLRRIKTAKIVMNTIIFQQTWNGALFFPMNMDDWNWTPLPVVFDSATPKM